MIEITRNGATVTCAVAVLPEAVWVAVIVALPAATALTSPVGLTVATPVADEAKVEPKLMSRVLPSLRVPTTSRDCMPPTSRPTALGAMAIEVMSATLGELGSDGWHPASNTPEQAARASNAICLRSAMSCLRHRRPMQVRAPGGKRAPGKESAFTPKSTQRSPPLSINGQRGWMLQCGNRPPGVRRSAGPVPPHASLGRR